jgi:hypothetical protein
MKKDLSGKKMNLEYYTFVVSQFINVVCDILVLICGFVIVCVYELFTWKRKKMASPSA